MGLALSLVSGLALCSACTGLEGTITIAVVTAPDSDLRDRVVRARLTSSDPPATVEIERAADGSFALGFDLEATGTASTITFEGFDTDGALIAFGRTPPLPVQALDADISIYVAPPMSLAEAPVTLPTARSAMGIAHLPYGAALIGGRSADGEPSTALDIYNTYDHDFQIGLDLPEARADITAIAGTTGGIFLFGGVDGTGGEAATYWRFDTNAPPAGSYSEQTPNPEWARSGARAAAIGTERFLLTGEPALVIDGLGNTVEDAPDAPALAGTATSIVFDGEYHTLFIGAGNGEGGGWMLRDGTFEALDEPALRRIGHGTVVLPDATALTIAGQTGEFFDTAGFTVDPRSGTITRRADLLTVARAEAAVVSTPEYVFVGGGLDRDGAVVPDAEILDAVTLEPIASLPLLVPRHSAQASALSNGQIAIFGGLDAAGQPVATIELFTPAP